MNHSLLLYYGAYVLHTEGTFVLLLKIPLWQMQDVEKPCLRQPPIRRVFIGELHQGYSHPAKNHEVRQRLARDDVRACWLYSVGYL